MGSVPEGSDDDYAPCHKVVDGPLAPVQSHANQGRDHQAPRHHKELNRRRVIDAEADSPNCRVAEFPRDELHDRSESGMAKRQRSPVEALDPDVGQPFSEGCPGRRSLEQNKIGADWEGEQQEGRSMSSARPVEPSPDLRHNKDRQPQSAHIGEDDNVVDDQRGVAPHRQSSSRAQLSG